MVVGGLANRYFQTTSGHRCRIRVLMIWVDPILVFRIHRPGMTLLVAEATGTEHRETRSRMSVGQHTALAEKRQFPTVLIVENDHGQLPYERTPDKPMLSHALGVMSLQFFLKFRGRELSPVLPEPSGGNCETNGELELFDYRKCRIGNDRASIRIHDYRV